MEYYRLNDRGVPVREFDERTWARWLETDPRRYLLCTEWDAVDGHVEVKTNFTGFDLRSCKDRVGGTRPILWDTEAILYPTRNSQVHDPSETIGAMRYTSEQEARKGHERMIRELTGVGVQPGGNGL